MIISIVYSNKYYSMSAQTFCYLLTYRLFLTSWYQFTVYHCTVYTLVTAGTEVRVHLHQCRGVPDYQDHQCSMVELRTYGTVRTLCAVRLYCMVPGTTLSVFLVFAFTVPRVPLISQHLLLPAVTVRAVMKL